MVKNLPVDAGDMGLIPGLGRSPGEENGYPLQYSCLKNSNDRGAWWATVHGGGVTKETEMKTKHHTFYKMGTVTQTSFVVRTIFRMIIDFHFPILCLLCTEGKIHKTTGPVA